MLYTVQYCTKVQYSQLPQLMWRIWKPVVLQRAVNEPLPLAFLGAHFTQAFSRVELPPRRVVSPHGVMSATSEDAAVRRDRAARAAELRISQAFESTSKRQGRVHDSNQGHGSNLSSGRGVLGKRPASTRMDFHEPCSSKSTGTRVQAALSLEPDVSSTAGDDRGEIRKRGRSEAKDTSVSVVAQQSTTGELNLGMRITLHQYQAFLILR